MHKFIFALVCALSAFAASAFAARTVGTYFGPKELAHFREVFNKGFESKDLQEIYYASFHKENIPRGSKEFCQKIAQLHANAARNIERDFYYIALHKKVGCSDKIAVTVEEPKYDFNSSHDIFYHVAAYRALGNTLNDEAKSKLARRLQTILKKNDTPASLAYAFNLAPELGAAGAFLADRMEDAIAQADQNGQMLQYPNGLTVTSLVFTGIFQVSNEYKKPLPVNAAKAEKFANYFLSRRTVQKSRGIHLLLEALKPLISAKSIAPICIQAIGNGQVLPGVQSLNIAIYDILGNPVTPSLKDVSATIYINGKKSSAGKLKLKSSDNTVYALDLSSYKLTSGIYEAEITANNVYSRKLQFKILGSVSLPSLEIGVVEIDAGTAGAAALNSVSFLKKYDEELTATIGQKILLKANLVDEETKEPIMVQQAFVRFYSSQQDKEVIYIAQRENGKAYKFDLNIKTEAGSFEHKSGLYQVYFIVGDAAISNSFEWYVADVTLTFPPGPQIEKKAQDSIRHPLPEIVHQFRVPEKRPPQVISDFFSVLCLAPLALLFIGWYKLGVNVSNFKFTLPAIGFHLGLTSIFGLFVLFWLQLNMFQTLKALVPLSLFTFVFGQRLLRSILQQRISKSN